MLAFGVVTKLGALMVGISYLLIFTPSNFIHQVTIPNPIIGGIFTVMFGIITAVGLSNLQFVDLNSTRNLFVLGFSIFFALVLPKWMEGNPEAISTGSITANSILTVILSSSMFIAMLLGFLLDNTIPGQLPFPRFYFDSPQAGSPEERGLIAWQNQHISQEQQVGRQPLFQKPSYPVRMQREGRH